MIDYIDTERENPTFASARVLVLFILHNFGACGGFRSFEF